MKDQFGRNITNLRISVTQRCNLNCFYCHKEGESGSVQELQVEEIIRRVNILKEYGIKSVKITGGEPLMRTDLEQIIKGINELGIKDISMTTNGTLLEKRAQSLRKAGLSRMNIGCDSLSQYLDKNKSSIVNGLDAAKKAGFENIKLNMVVLKGINNNEIPQMMEFAKEHGCTLQLIELINLNNEFYEKYHFSLETIEKGLEKQADRIVTREMQSRKQYIMGELTVEIVRPHKKKFCRNCNKIRITSDGKIKPCLMKTQHFEFKDSGSVIEAIKARDIYNESRHKP